MPDIHDHRILILDFGSQYTQLIARRVREARVYCEIHPFDIDDKTIQAFAPKGIILSGSPESVNENEIAFQVSETIFSLGIPVLGLCYGMQTMAKQLGGQVKAANHREFGYAQVRAHNHSKLLRYIEDHVSPSGHGLLDVWMSHGDQVVTMPPGFKLIASTENAPIAGMADEQRSFYGLQFHPEVTHTPQGLRIIKRFCHDICHCEQLWSPVNIIANYVQTLRQQVAPEEKVLLALSGGVDSSVVAALLHQAIGEQLICVFVDNGLLRLQESEQVMRTFAQHIEINVILVNAQAQFLTALAGVTDPEEKRKIIGNVFIDVFEAQAQHISQIKWLAQGTIYPDVIESAGAKTGKAQVIKSHHNVGGLPERMQLKLIEPLRELFKDEVRKLGVELGLPEEIVHRHPFPGPGLGVRILGEVSAKFAEMLRLADAIFIEELRRSGWYNKVNQAFAVFLPIKSVGVMGDARKYEYVIALRAVETVDYMTARWAKLPYELLEKVSTRIINEVPGISRVTYDISSKPPATIEWE